MHIFTLMTNKWGHSVSYTMSNLLIAKNYFYLAEYTLENKFGYLRMKKPEYLIGKPQENTKSNSNFKASNIY